MPPAADNILTADFQGVSLPANRTDGRGIKRVRESIVKGEYSAAIRFLDNVLQRQEDSFLLNGSSGEYAGLKETAWQIIRDLPPLARQAYETTYGPVARRLLRQAVADGNYDSLQQLTRRYFHTPAGHEAALLLARNEADLGRHLSAALVYQQLLEAPAAVARFQPQLSLWASLSWLALGDEDRAKEILLQLEAAAAQEVVIGGQKLLLDFSVADWPERLLEMTGVSNSGNAVAAMQWLTSGGNPQRNGQATGGLPHLRADWQARLLAHPALESVHQEISFGRTQHRLPLIPASVPLAVGNALITRSVHNLVAIDFTTGKRIWQVQPQRVPAFEQLISGALGEQDDGQIDPARTFNQRIWEDYLYSTISSDGQRVYVIRDLRPPNWPRYESWPGAGMRNDGANGSSRETNRLCAYDLATQGKLVWEVDGAASGNKMQGAFFLGAPLTVGQSLYGLLEIRSEKAIYLVALDRQTGKLQWRQHLANLEAGILADPDRRLQAVIPSYDEGMLVCPTGVGVVVGVDLAKRALAWAYRYEINRKYPQQLRQARSRGRSTGRSQWIDATATIADGRILLSPPGSEKLHCLDLATGALQWRQPRRQGLLLAGVDENHVVVVDQKGVRALRLDDGKSAWTKGRLDFPVDSYPSGRGFLSKGKYYVPLSSAEVVAIDVQEGAVVARAQSRDRTPLGNLVCHRGTVLSQGGAFLNRFGQLEVLREQSLRRREINPNDHEALRTLGEMALNDNQLAEAIELVEQAYASEPDDVQTREVLGECLRAALNENYAKYRDRLPLLEEIQSSSEKDRLALLRLQARGLLEIGDIVDAFDVCYRMALSVDSASTSVSLGPHHQAKLSRWIRAQVAAIWAQANGSQRAEMSSRLEEAIAGIAGDADRNNVDRLFRCFGALEICAPMGLDVAARHAAEGNLLAAQQLLVYLTTSRDSAVRAEAVARCSRLLHRADVPSLAASYDRQLATSLADQECLDGKTGKQCLGEWGTREGGGGESRGNESGPLGSRRRPNGSAAISDRGGLDWPYGQVEADTAGDPKQGRTTRSARSSFFEVQLERSDEVLGYCNVFQAHSSGEVRVRDRQGNEFFRAQLRPPNGRRISAPATAYGVSHGNLLLLSSGQQFYAFDTLPSEGESAPKLLWQKQAVSNLEQRQEYLVMNRQSRRQQERPGSKRPPRAERNGRWIGVIGPVTHDSCVMQDQSRLFCVDPLTGELLWQRSDMPAGCDLFGDHEFVFAVERDSTRALVLSTADGRLLKEVAVPVWRERLASRGHHIIRWRRLANRHFELSSLDASTGEVAWKHIVDPSSQVDIAMSRFVAIADELGRCVVVDAETGNLLLDEPIRKTGGNEVVDLQAIHLYAGSDHFVLAVQLTQGASKPTHRVSLLNPLDYLSFTGHIYVFDRATGRSAFAPPATVEHRALILCQPVDLPVIAFAGNIPRQTNRGTEQEMRLLLIEKASGRLLYMKDDLEASGNHLILHADTLGADEVVVEMLRKEIRLKFTGRNRPPEPPVLQEVNRMEERAGNGLMGIGQKIFGF